MAAFVLMTQISGPACRSRFFDRHTLCQLDKREIRVSQRVLI